MLNVSLGCYWAMRAKMRVIPSQPLPALSAFPRAESPRSNLVIDSFYSWRRSRFPTSTRSRSIDSIRGTISPEAALVAGDVWTGRRAASSADNVTN